jgi:hypothetical protein
MSEHAKKPPSPSFPVEKQEAAIKVRRCANCNHTEGNHQPSMRHGSTGCRTCYCMAFVLREAKA